MTMQKANQTHIKTHNSQLILKMIYEKGPLSRAELVELTHLTAPTVSDLVLDLIEAGLAEEIGFGPSTGGKRPILLNLVDDSRYLVGLDLGRGDFRGALVNLRGKVHYQNELPLVTRKGEDALAVVYELVDDLIRRAPIPLLGIGIGAPGLVGAADGTIQRAVNVEWQNLPLRDILQERYNLPVYLANDCQAAALAEYTYPQGSNRVSAKNLVVINASYGVGAGILINGQILHGSPSGAGEIGHVKVVEGGEACQCGNHGCLETVISTRAIRRQVRARLGLSATDEINFDQICERFQAGDAEIQLVVEQAGTYLGSAVANLIGVLGPCRVVIAGSISNLGQPFVEIVKAEVHRRYQLPLVEEVEIDISSLGANIVLLGGAALLLQGELGITRMPGKLEP